MDIGRVQRRFTAEPLESPVPAAPEAPVENVDGLGPVEPLEPRTVTADARP
ncbi:hypothetical protein [Actinomycetospora soli]|uniref:hypothetical protein n=1 Tax=Actinomycetospora soli TaxID=2893887 RepID=UPI001E45094A|nr:hypothetical protein [Actinomycetospora soli]MCD2187944.1 hypothetical protein [Actinomycetospora soli]